MILVISKSSGSMASFIFKEVVLIVTWRFRDGVQSLCGRSRRGEEFGTFPDSWELIQLAMLAEARGSNMKETRMAIREPWLSRGEDWVCFGSGH